MDRTPDGSETGGGGTPPLDLRVARLEGDVADIKTLLQALDAKVSSFDTKLGSLDTKLSTLNTKLSTIAEAVAEMRGRLSQSPTWLQLLVSLIATWGAGAAIVGMIFRLGAK